MNRRPLKHEGRAHWQQIAPPATKPVAEEISPSARVEDWGELKIGSRVLTRSSGDITRVGTVEDMSEDASLVWVRLDALGRLLITPEDEVTLWRMK